MKGIVSDSIDWKQNWNILKLLIYKEWVTKYKGTYLGYLWSIAHPLMLTLIFYIAFKIVTKMPIENYVLFLALGLFPWQWFMNSINSAMWSFRGNVSLIKKSVFPRYLLPLASMIVDMFHFLVSIPILVVLLVLYQQPIFHISWVLLLPLMLLLQGIFSYSLGLLFGTLHLFFRDIERFVSLMLTFIFYLTPIFYAFEMIPQHLRLYFYLNPMVPLIHLWRDLFLYGVLPWKELSIATGEIAVSAWIAWRIYRKYEPKFAEQL